MSEHSHSANAQFHDPAHAAEFDRRAAVSDIRGKLAERLKLKARFQERYFGYEKTGDRIHIRGGFHFGLVAGEKRPGAG